MRSVIEEIISRLPEDRRQAARELLEQKTARTETERMLTLDLYGRELSTREQSILTLVAEGDTNGEAAAVLGLSEETVKCYLRRILAKLGAVNRTHAVAIAFRQGLLT